MKVMCFLCLFDNFWDLSKDFQWLSCFPRGCILGVQNGSFHWKVGVHECWRRSSWWFLMLALLYIHPYGRMFPGRYGSDCNYLLGKVWKLNQYEENLWFACSFSSLVHSEKNLTFNAPFLRVRVPQDTLSTKVLEGGVIKIGAPTRQKRIYLDDQSLQTQNASIQTLTRKYLSNLLRPQPISPQMMV